MAYEDFDDNRVRHLEMIQAVVTRLSNEGFLIKGWAITVASALLGFAVEKESAALALVAVAPTLAFWLLDMTFLRSERLFRALHDHVRRDTGKVEPFSMAAMGPGFIKVAAEDPGGGIDSRLKAFWRPALRLLYGTIVLATVVVAIVISTAGDSTAAEIPARLV